MAKTKPATDETKLVLTTLFIFLCALLFFCIFHVSPPSYSDTYEYALYAKNCFENNLCHSYGAEYTVNGLYSGALWNKLIVLAHKAGFSLFILHTLSIICLSLSVSIFYLFLKRSIHNIQAIVATMVIMFLFLIFTEYPILWNDSLQPLFMSLFFLFLFKILEDGKNRDVIFASISFAFLMETHIVTALLMPALLIILLVASRQKLLSLITATLVILLIRGIISSDAMLINWQWLLQKGLLASFITSIVLCFLISIKLTPIYKQLYSREKNLNILYIITIYAAFLVLALGNLLNVEMSFPYYEPALPGIAVFITNIRPKLFEKLFLKYSKTRCFIQKFPAVPGIAIMSLILIAWYFLLILKLPVISACSRWTIPDMKQIAQEFEKEGYSYSYLREHMFGPSKNNIMRAMLYYEDKENTDWANHDLLVFKTEEKIGEVSGFKNRTVKLENSKILHILQFNSWLDMKNVEVCLEFPGQKSCIEIDLNRPYGKVNNSEDYITRFYNLESSVYRSFQLNDITNFKKARKIVLSIPFKKDWSNYQTIDPHDRIYAIADEFCRSHWTIETSEQNKDIEKISKTVVKIGKNAQPDVLRLVNRVANRGIRGVYYPSIIEFPFYNEKMANAILEQSSKHKSPILRAVNNILGENAE